MREAQHPDEFPLAVLRRRAGAGASGELIAASDGLEVHLYLLEGRLAWGTSSLAPAAFTRYLMDACALADSDLAEVIAQCQRTGARLGETLVSWGLAPAPKVKAALREQIRDVLGTLATAGPMPSLFLPRTLQYDRELTFDLGEVWPGDAPCEAADVAGEVWTLSDLAAALPNPLWVAIVEDGAVTGGYPELVSLPVALLGTLAAQLGEEGAHVLTVRSIHGAIVGCQLTGGGQSVWCGLPAHGKLGAAAAFLRALALAGQREAEDAGDAPAVWTTSAAPPLRSMAALENAMRTADDLQAVVVVHEPSGTTAAVQREGFDSSAMRVQAGRLSRLLRGSLLGAVGTRAAHVSHDRISVGVQCPGGACFGTLVSSSAAVGLWLALRRRSSQGLGWALLETLARQINDDVAV